VGVKVNKRGRFQVDLRSSYVGVYPDARTAGLIFAAGTRQLELGKPLPVVIRELRGKSGTQTLDEYARGWLPTCTNKREALYRHDLAWRRMSPYVGKRTLDALTPDDVKRLVDRLADRYSPKTVRTTVATLSMMLADARDAGLAPRNAAARIRNLPDIRESERRAFSRATLDTLIAHAPEGYAPLLAVAGLTGMRIGELLGLRWEHITRDGILIEQQVGASDRRVGPTKTKRTRTIPLTTDTTAWLGVQRAESVRPDSPWVFPNFYGDAMPRTTMRRAFTRAARAAGVSATPHEYRHSFGSWCLQAGVPVHVVAEWMGHSPDMLMRVYAHEIKESRGENVARLQAYLDGDDTGTHR
jgi:integrase